MKKPQLEHAYGICRGIARRAARNFYYGFMLLPRDKRNALSAVYAFMRHADDIADDPKLTLAQKRKELNAWREQVQRIVEGERTDDPVLMALQDAQHRYAIPPALFEQLVDGAEMDLEADALLAERPGEPVCCATFEQLRQYCYHVASVVGLVCIKIFGYRDPRAEELAEQVGLAFQLTNIIRDVKEDALLGRVYLPEEDLQRFGRTPADLAASRLGNGFQPAAFQPVLAFEADRARQAYRAAEELLPLIDDDARPALWVLVTIYRQLLEKIAARGYDVFGEKVRLTTAEKLRVLGRGFLQRLA